jgi:hypothetical protein
LNVDAGTKLGALNLARYCALLAERAEGGSVEQRDGIVLFAGAHAYPGTHTNGVIRTSEQLSAREVVDEADRWFRPKKRGYTIWTRGGVDSDLDQLASELALTRRPPPEGMAYMLVDGPLPADQFVAPQGVEIVRIATEQQAHDYLSVVGEAFELKELDTATVGKLFSEPAALLDERVATYVAYADDRPVSGVVMMCADGFAGTYAGVSSPAALENPVIFRAALAGVSIAKVCLCVAVNDGFAAGARFAGGTASAAGRPVWASMGYETTEFFHRYIRRPPF